MSNNERFAKLDEMPTEKLESLLSLDIDSVPGVNLEPEDILHILEVIQAREEAAGTAIVVDTNAAWENFNDNYRPAQPLASQNVISPRKPNHFKRLVISLVAAVIFVVGCAAAASASGIDLWGSLVQWASQTFGLDNDMNYGDRVSGKQVLPCDDLQQMLKVYGINDKIVPTWLPDGFEQSLCDRSVTPNMVTYQATYKNGQQEIIIQIFAYQDGQQSMETYEKLENGYETYNVGNRKHYIAKNTDGSTVALWNSSNYECNLHGSISVAEIKEILNSIYGG